MNYRIFALLSLLFFCVSGSVFAQNKTQNADADDMQLEPSSQKAPAKRGAKKGTKGNQKDPVVLTSAVKFEKVNINGNNNWIKATVKLRCIENPDAEKNDLNPDWVRNVTVKLVCAYEDAKMSTSSSPKFVWFSSSATLFAMQRNKESTITFYIPWEAYSVYRIKDAPYAWLVDLTVNGTNYPLTKSNIKQRCSLGTQGKTFVEKAMANLDANKGVMVPFEKAPFAVKINEYKSARNDSTLVLE